MEWFILSAVILVLMLYFRTESARKRHDHRRWMSAVVVADLLLVLYLAAGKNVLSKITPEISIILQVHILVALATVVCYLLAFYYGFKLATGHGQYRRHMQIIDRIVVPARILVLLTMLVLKLNSSPQTAASVGASMASENPPVSVTTQQTSQR